MPTTDMLVANILFNSVVSTRNAKFMTMNISKFYLMTPLKRQEYIHISIKDIPNKIINEYKLRDISDINGSVYIQDNRGMYGLTQSGLLEKELLEIDSTREATDRASWSLVFGHTIGEQYSSHSGSMILESNMLEKKMRYTSSTPLRKTTM